MSDITLPALKIGEGLSIQGTPGRERRELISDREVTRRIGNGERVNVIKVGNDCWQVLS